MTEFLEENLGIVRDGVLTINETILFAIVAVLALLLVVIIVKFIVKAIYNSLPGKKKTIFSHRKNQYKNRIGKKSKASKKKRDFWSSM